MCWTYRFLMDDRALRVSTYGIVRENRDYFAVLLGSLGQVLLRTESFRQEQPVHRLLDQIRECCTKDECFEIKTSGNALYFVVKTFDEHVLAISDQCHDLKTVQRKIAHVKEIGRFAAVVPLPKIVRRQNEK